MTKRALFPNYWASGGVAIDPDLDTTAPSYEPNRYETKGWHSEKPPEEWQNFLTQIGDLKIIEWIISGIPPLDASVTYQNGAVYQSGGVVYVVVGGVGKPVISLKSTEYTGFVTGLQNAINNHLAADNPHQDTVNTLVDKSYIKTDVDNFFGSASDPRTIVYHKNLTGGSVHGETPAQVGTVPASGGTFTGPVVMQNNVVVNISPSKLVHLNASTAVFEIASGTVSLGIDNAGNCFIINTAGNWLIMTEASYDSFQIRWNNRFALPIPLHDMLLADSINDSRSVGPWMIQTSAAPVFTPNGGLRIDNNTVTFTGFDVQAACTIYVVARDTAGVRVTAVSDAASASYVSMATLMNNMGLSAAPYVERIVVYDRLSSYQKSMLVA